MEKANNGIRYCTRCGRKLQKNGKTKAGKTRWRCPKCGTCRVMTRPDVRARNIAAGMNHLLTDTDHQNDLMKKTGRSRSSISRELKEFINQPLRKPVITGEVYDWFAIDATWLSCGAVAIARNSKYVIYWEFGKRECLGLWLKLLKQIPRPSAILCDGQKGMLEAIRRTYGEGILIQRCLYHVQSNMLIYSKSGRDHPAAVGIRRLAYQLMDVTTPIEADNFIQEFYALYDEYKDYLDEHTMTMRGNGVMWPQYIHKRLRLAFSGLDDVIKLNQLFTFVYHPKLHIPRTNNVVEGGLNSRISELLQSHRGMTMQGQQTLVNEQLLTRTEEYQLSQRRQQGSKKN